MKYGPRQTAELLAQAKVIRDEEQLLWRAIADRLGVELDWLMWHKGKIEGAKEGRILAIKKNDMDQTLEKIKAMRERKAPWKTIGETLGVDWLKLYRSYRYHTEGTART